MMNGRSLSIHHLCPSPFLPTPQHTGKAFVPATTSKNYIQSKNRIGSTVKGWLKEHIKHRKVKHNTKKAVKFFNDLERSLLLHPIQVC
jgi:hypothetical protein